MNIKDIDNEILRLKNSFIADKMHELDNVSQALSSLTYKDKDFVSLSKKKTALEDILNNFNNITKMNNDIKELESLISKNFDKEISDEIEKLKDKIHSLIVDLSIQSVFKNKEDSLNCFLEINAGAGGLDSQDWVLIMTRMYSLYFDKRKFQYEIDDKNEGEHTNCLKNIRFLIKGQNVFGLLKNETGIHRLVRISPFNAKAKRQTSFAGVFVYPEIDDSIDIKIEEKDLLFESCKSSGAGGQHVNKTESAMRVTHLPTGISIKCQISKSQIQNKELALKNLKSRLYNIELEKKSAKIESILEEKDDISWGNQIRNYVFHPYKMIKDLRSNFSTSNIDKVLNGDLDEIINSVLFN